MKSFSKRPLLITGSFFFIVFFVGMTCCTKVDNRLGLNFIPEEQTMKVYQEVFGIAPGEQINTYTQMLDSIQASGMNALIIGKTEGGSATFGKATASSIFQILPFAAEDVFTSTSSIKGYNFRERNIADSLKLHILPTYLYGDETKEQTFIIYPLRDTVVVDSIYYQGSDYLSLRENIPLFRLKLKGKYTEIATFKTEATPEGLAFLQDLISDTTYYYENRVDFRKKAKGFMIEPAADSPEDAAMYSINLSETYFRLQMHTMISGSSVPKDTMYIDHYMSDVVDKTREVSNVSIIDLRHNYGTDIENALTLTESTTPQDVTYIDGQAGVTTLLEFPDSFFEAVIARRDIENADMSLNQAKLHIYMESDDTDAMNASFPKLGSFYDFRFNSNIPDYSLLDEYGIEQGGNGYYLSYGGELNRTHGYYELDITTFLYYAIKMYDRKKAGDKDFDEDYMKFTLAPTSHYMYLLNRLKDGGQTAVKGTGSLKPMELKLTYTLIDK